MFKVLRRKLQIISEKIQGLDFTKSVQSSEMGFDPAVVHRSTPSGNKWLGDVLRSIDITDSDSIIDIGCGKGSAMRVMLDFPFCRVDGIEISERVANIARNNFKRLKVSRCRIFCCDAVEFSGLADYNIFYFYNPFPRSIWSKFLVKFSELRKFNKEIVVIYNNPTCHELLVGEGGFHKVAEYPDEWGNRIFVYSNRNAEISRVKQRKNRLLTMLRLCVGLVSGIVLIAFNGAGDAYAQKNTISVYTKKIRGPLNKMVFGNNLLGCDYALDGKGGNKPHSYGYTDYGAGIWDSKWNKLNKEVIHLAKDAGISIARFPGGGAANWYDWKKAVGQGRQHYLYGIEEFLQTCREINIEAVYTLNCSSSDDASIKELVRFLSRTGGVHYIEIGNEVWEHMGPEEYARRYLRCYDIIKAVNNEIKVGVVLYNFSWNKNVLAEVRDRVDFGIIHVYPSHINTLFVSEDDLIDSRDIFQRAWANALRGTEHWIAGTLALVREQSGKDVPLAVTEYNGGFSQSRPVPYRHCLGNALLNAELIRIFSEPKNNILMANYWNFVNEYWGMISNGFNYEHKGFNAPYFKRPNYYVFEMYHKYFSDVLLDADTESDAYDFSDQKDLVQNLTQDFNIGSVEGENLLAGVWRNENVIGVNVDDKDGILRIEFSRPESFNYFHSYKMVDVKPATYYKLSGYIKVDNLVDNQGGVCLEILDGRGWTLTKSAANTVKLSGSSDWQFVEVMYLTLPDARTVSVIARRIGDVGPLRGVAEFRDVKLEKFVSTLNTTIPYLSVNASKSRDGKKVSLMVVNKNTDSPVPVTINLNDFILSGKVSVHVLNGPSVASTNEKAQDTVRVKSYSYKAFGDKFDYVFEPHSLTAIELEGAEAL